MIKQVYLYLTTHEMFIFELVIRKKQMVETIPSKRWGMNWKVGLILMSIKNLLQKWNYTQTVLVKMSGIQFISLMECQQKVNRLKQQETNIGIQLNIISGYILKVKRQDQQLLKVKGRNPFQVHFTILHLMEHLD